MAGRLADAVVLSAEERAFLDAQVRRHKAPRSLSDRCRMILLCADGLQSKEVAERLGVHEHTVGKWRRRFVADRIEGLTDEHRPGRPRTVSDAQVAQVIERTLNTTPRDATHWSIRSMAAETGLSHTTIRRIWGALACSRIGRRRSSFPKIRCSSTRYRISSACTCHPRTGQSCCALTRSPRSRRSTASSQSCRWHRVCLSGAPILTFATVRHLCSLRSISPRGSHREVL